MSIVFSRSLSSLSFQLSVLHRELLSQPPQLELCRSLCRHDNQSSGANVVEERELRWAKKRKKMMDEAGRCAPPLL